MGLVSGSGVNVDPARLLARGGQGEVFEVASQPNVVFKRYLASELEKDPTLPDRLAVMLANRPSKWREASSHHILVTWPTDTVAEDGRFVGCLMPRIDSGRTARLLRVADPTDRDGATGATEWLRGFTWRYLLATAANLAFGVEVLHGADVVIGDFNDANVAVTPAARVTLFDCDSMQITDPLSGRHFLCRVGRPDFTPPELVGADLRTTVRPRSSDLFALAVHIHLLLLQGEHPFRGHWNGLGDPPVETVLARRGLWTYGGQEKIGPRPAAIGINLLPPDIIALFRRALVKGASTPGLRPSATEWKEALTHLATAGVAPIDELNDGFSLFCDDIKADEYARKRAEICVITFGGTARVAVDFTEGRDLQPQPFVAEGGTPMGAAVNLALDEITRQKQTYKDAGLLYYRPWLFVISDGSPTDPTVFEQAAQRARDMEAAKGVSVFTVGVGEAADLTRMAKLSATRQPLRLRGLSFQELFTWLSGSMQRVSQSTPPAPAAPGEPAGGAPGEQLALAPVDTWAHTEL